MRMADVKSGDRLISTVSGRRRVVLVMRIDEHRGHRPVLVRVLATGHEVWRNAQALRTVESVRERLTSLQRLQARPEANDEVLAGRMCADCGEQGKATGHQDCRYPQEDHE